jgi:CheY-like chemotaxis protein
MAGLSKRILLVEDEFTVRKLVTRYLVAAGYVVCTAVDGLDGIAKLRGGLPDLIISDLNMPRMSGTEFLGVVRRRFPQMPAIAISGLAKDEITERLAADAYWQKQGFLINELLDAISDLTGKFCTRPARTPPCDDLVPARLEGASDYVIACQDCLREFSVSRVLQPGQDRKSTTCVHCGRFIHFVVAPFLEAVRAGAPAPAAASPTFTLADTATENLRGPQLECGQPADMPDQIQNKSAKVAEAESLWHRNENGAS